MDLDPLVNDFPVLETERLVLRRLVPADLADATTFFGDPDVGRHATWFPLVSRYGVAGLLDYIERRRAAGKMAVWGIVPKEGGRVIGFCGLVAIAPDDRRAEIGYSLARTYWGTRLRIRGRPRGAGMRVRRARLQSDRGVLHGGERRLDPGAGES